MAGESEMNASAPGGVRDTDSVVRAEVKISGAVQGVGFRPLVYRLAVECGLAGWVFNSSQGVVIEVEGHYNQIDSFLQRLINEPPPRARVQDVQYRFLNPAGYRLFEVRPSDDFGGKSTWILPDIAVCPDCLREMFEPDNRRYRYPFINCTNCGPRYSIIEALPYDRAHTTMKAFAMCPSCRAEYENPHDRRFHAQPNACPDCGPHLEMWDARGKILATHDQALPEAVDAIRCGRILALKGLGGFQLLVDARDAGAVDRLRRRKARESKPFALMYPSLSMVERQCAVSPAERQLLDSPASPIVLLRRLNKSGSGEEIASSSAAPGNPNLGVMLPYTPLHHLLLKELGFPVVATSGNLSDEPLCFDEREALDRLGGIADVFLVHNRPIARPVDDSVVRVLLNREQVLRNARGYAPTPVSISSPVPPCLAVGAHLKNSVALSNGSQVYLSQHIGDLSTRAAYASFVSAIRDLSALYELSPGYAITDRHPDYLSTQYAASAGCSTQKVQHHLAHILSCMGEHQVEGPVLGVSWDGTGLGDDGTIWGGEFLLVDSLSYTRMAHLRYFPLPGGEAAIHEPRRAALGLLFEIFGDEVFTMDGIPSLAGFSTDERGIIKQALRRGVNTPVTSSAGRLFDAVSSLLGVCQVTGYEGQAAMMLEYAADGVRTDTTFEYEMIGRDDTLVIDWSPMIRTILSEMRMGNNVGLIATAFHNTLVEMIVDISVRAGQKQVVLSGGCFQNRYLTERTVRRLRTAGFEPYWHQRVPPNDGGIALGQIVAAARAGWGR